MADEPKIYTVEEVQGILRVSRKTVLKLIYGGQLKAFKAGRAWRVTQGQLESFTYGGDSGE